jgi:hypothetical protein
MPSKRSESQSQRPENAGYMAHGGGVYVEEWRSTLGGLLIRRKMASFLCEEFISAREQRWIGGVG